MKNELDIQTSRPEFKREDFLESSKAFDWLAQFEDDAFIFAQKEELLKENARGVGIKSFKTLWSTYKHKTSAAQPSMPQVVIDLPDRTLRFFPGQYIIDEAGVRFIQYGVEFVVCPHMIIPTKRLINVDDGQERLEISFYKGSTLRSIVVDKAVIASSTRIVELAAYGIVVTTESARMLSKYLLEIENMNYLPMCDGDAIFDALPEQHSVSHLGWTSQGSFSPFVPDLVFDGELSFQHVFESVKASGDPEKWISMMKELRALRGPGRMFLAGSFASVLVEPCGLLPFFVHAWGPSGVGKTCALMIAASVWASPSVGQYIMTFNSTQVGSELYAGFLHSMPIILDELQIRASSGDRDFDRTIYTLTEGTGRVRGKKAGGIQKQQTWKNIILSSGEAPITSGSSGGGSINRVISIEVQDKVFQDLPRLCRVISANYGHAGRSFVEYLQQPGNLDQARELQQEYYRQLLEADVSTEKQIAAGSVLLAADKIATDLIFKDENALAIEDIVQVVAAPDLIDVNRRALSYLMDLVISNEERFLETANLERWGKIVDTVDQRRLYIVRSIFDREMQRAGYNSQSFLAWASRQQILETEPTRRTFKARISGNSVWTVCIDLIKAEALLKP